MTESTRSATEVEKVDMYDRGESGGCKDIVSDNDASNVRVVEGGR